MLYTSDPILKMRKVRHRNLVLVGGRAGISTQPSIFTSKHKKKKTKATGY